MLVGNLMEMKEGERVKKYDRLIAVDTHVTTLWSNIRLSRPFWKYFRCYSHPLGRCSIRSKNYAGKYSVERTPIRTLVFHSAVEIFINPLDASKFLPITF